MCLCIFKTLKKRLDFSFLTFISNKYDFSVIKCTFWNYSNPFSCEFILNCLHWLLDKIYDNTNNMYILLFLVYKAYF